MEFYFFGYGLGYGFPFLGLGVALMSFVYIGLKIVLQVATTEAKTYPLTAETEVEWSNDENNKT